MPLDLAVAHLGNAVPKALRVPRRLQQVRGLFERVVLIRETRYAVAFLETISTAIWLSLTSWINGNSR